MTPPADAGMGRNLRLGLYGLSLAVSLIGAVAVNADQLGIGQVMLGVLVVLMVAAVYAG